jgi:HEAT repeat protein
MPAPALSQPRPIDWEHDPFESVINHLLTYPLAMGTGSEPFWLLRRRPEHETKKVEAVLLDMLVNHAKDPTDPWWLRDAITERMIEALGTDGLRSEAARPMLAQFAAHHEKELIREHAVAALIWKDADDELLRKALFDESFLVRSAAGSLLAHERDESGRFIAKLIKALDDENGEIRGNAAYALGHYGPRAGCAVPALIAMLGSRGPWLRRRAAIALGDIGPAAEPAIPKLLYLLDHKKDNRLDVVQALAAIGPNALPGLCERLKHRSRGVREMAMEGIRLMEGDRGPAIEPLIELLGNPDGELFHRAVKALESIGGDAVPALTAAATASNSAQIRAFSALVWHHLAPNDRTAAELVAEAMHHPNVRIRAFILSKLFMCNEYELVAAKSVQNILIPAIIRALDDKEAEIRELAAMRIADLGAAASAAIPKLIEHLNDPDDDVCCSACVALSGHGRIDEAAVPKLARLLRSDYDMTKKWAAIVLGNIGADARDALPLLRTVKPSPNSDDELKAEMRAQVLEAIHKIEGKHK